MGTFEKSAELAVLSASRNIPVWFEQTVTPQLAGSNTSGIPSSTGSGIDMLDVVKCIFAVYVRERAHQRSARITVPVHDTATTYGATIGGTGVSYVAGGDVRADQALRGLQSALALSGPIAALTAATVINAAGDDVTSTPFDGSTADTIAATSATAILLRGATEAGYTIAFAPAGGAGTMAAVADAITCTMRIYATRKLGSGVSQWTWFDETEEDLTIKGWTDRLTVNGYRRAYVEILDVVATGDGATVTYAPGVFVGPAIAEG